MEPILFRDNLSIKKLDPEEEKDCFLVNELNKDELISGRNGYLWPMKNVFNDIRYLFSESIYGSPYGIYYQLNPVGFLDLSVIMHEGNKKFVDSSYALLDHYRGKGYMTKTLSEVAKLILLDKANIERVSLIIHPNNISSQKVALGAGFIREYSSYYEENEMFGYQKTKRML